MKVIERKTTTHTKIYELSEQDIEDIIRQHLGVHGDGEVEFDVSSGGFLRGATVKTEYTVVDL